MKLKVEIVNPTKKVNFEKHLCLNDEFPFRKNIGKKIEIYGFGDLFFVNAILKVL